MNASEAALLCRYVRACCPQQRFDSYTPDAWLDLLGDLPFGVAKAAACAVARQRPFVSPAEIRTAATIIRRNVRSAVRAEVESDDPEPDDVHVHVHIDWRRRVNAATMALADDRIGAGYYDLTRIDPTDTDTLATYPVTPVDDQQAIGR